MKEWKKKYWINSINGNCLRFGFHYFSLLCIIWKYPIYIWMLVKKLIPMEKREFHTIISYIFFFFSFSSCVLSQSILTEQCNKKKKKHLNVYIEWVSIKLATTYDHVIVNLQMKHTYRKPIQSIEITKKKIKREKNSV